MSAASGRVIKIVTSYVYPPIPPRQFDWCAWYDSDGEERGHYGYGATEAEAVAELVENYALQPDGLSTLRYDELG